MATWGTSIGEFDAGMGSYPGVTTVGEAQDAINVVAAQMLKLRNAISAGFERMEGLVGTLNSFGGKLEKELADLKTVVNGVGQGTVDLGNKFDTEMGTLRHQTQSEIGGIKVEMDNRWALMMSTMDQHNVQMQDLNNRLNNLNSSGGDIRQSLGAFFKTRPYKIWQRWGMINPNGRTGCIN